jgi:uncharacterized protein
LLRTPGFLPFYFLRLMPAMEDQHSIPPFTDPARDQDRSLALWMHLGPLIAFLGNMLVPIPFLSLIVAGILYYTQREKSTFIANHGRESLNFQITLAIVFVLLIIVMAVAFGGSLMSMIIGGMNDNDAAAGAGVVGLVSSSVAIGLVFLVVGVFALVVMIIASIRANDGKEFHYPLILRLVK